MAFDGSARPQRGVDFLHLEFCALDLDAATDAIAARASLGAPFAYVVTPNVDHVVSLAAEPARRPLYEAAWLAQYAALAHGRKIETVSAPPAHAGIYVIGGLGARGLTLAPLLGERIASEICGEPAPLSQFALDAIHPARFLHRALKRR